MKSITGILTSVALLLAAVIPAIALLRGLPYNLAILTGLSLAFATIPEELPLIVKAVLAVSPVSPCLIPLLICLLSGWRSEALQITHHRPSSEGCGGPGIRHYCRF